MDYDLIVIGGGPAGYLAAERACDQGLETIVIEKRELGGVCLNEGCIPTKTLLYSAKVCECIQEERARLGVLCNNATIDHGQVQKRKQDVVKTLVKGVQASLGRKKAEFVKGEAAIAKQGNIFHVKAAQQEYTARNVLLATGSVPVIPPIPGVQERIETGNILTNRELLDIETIPKELVIIGAGVIGLEMANYFNIAGSKVTVIEMLSTIGGAIDREAASILQSALEKQGITFYLNSRVTDVADCSITFERHGKKNKLAYQKLLLCVGRKPQSDVQGLKRLGVLLDQAAIVTNEQCMTNIAGLYAAGDVNGKYMLAHAAYREAEVAVNNMIGKKDRMDYEAVPGVIYTFPMEAAFVGMMEDEARKKGIHIAVKTVSANMSGRHIAEHGIGRGICKLVVDEEKQIILGAVLVTAYASEMIYALTLMIENKIPLESIKKTIFPHPTVCEVIREALFI